MAVRRAEFNRYSPQQHAAAVLMQCALALDPEVARNPEYRELDAPSGKRFYDQAAGALRQYLRLREGWRDKVGRHGSEPVWDSHWVNELLLPYNVLGSEAETLLRLLALLATFAHWIHPGKGHYASTGDNSSSTGWTDPKQASEGDAFRRRIAGQLAFAVGLAKSLSAPASVPSSSSSASAGGSSGGRKGGVGAASSIASASSSSSSARSSSAAAVVSLSEAQKATIARAFAEMGLPLPAC